MKILWLSHLVPYPPKGGVLQRAYHLLRELAAENEVYLFAFTQRDLLARRFPSVDAGLEEAHAHLSQFCKSVTFVPIPSEGMRYGRHILALASLFTVAPYTVNWLKSTSAYRLLREFSAATPIDLLHVDTISLVPYADLFPGVLKVLDHHNIESAMMERRANLETHVGKKIYFRQEGLKLQRYERKVCAQFDLHITCSTLDSQRLREVSSGLVIAEIPNGVETEFFKPQGTAEIANRLVFAGGLNWYANAQAVFFFANEVWPLLKQRIPDVTIDVIGEQPPHELQALSRRDPSFKVLGFVDDVRTYIDRASVYVCPIMDGGGTKLKVLDALAMGKALVAHPIACEGIDISDGKNVALASTPQEFVDQIVSLFGNSEVRRSMGKAARELILQHYSYDNIGRKMRERYRQLVGAGSSR